MSQLSQTLGANRAVNKVETKKQVDIEKVDVTE